MTGESWSSIANNLNLLDFYAVVVDPITPSTLYIGTRYGVGVPDEKSGEAVKVYVVRKDPALTEAELMAFCKEHLTGYKKPRYIEFRDELPKTNVGEILRRELRDAQLAAMAKRA